MSRFFLSVLGVAFAAAPAAAANYSATLVAPSSGKFVAQDIIWNCGADACQGATAESRPIVLCEALAKRAGRVATFLVEGRAFTADELNHCNSSAKANPAQLVAEQ